MTSLQWVSRRHWLPHPVPGQAKSGNGFLEPQNSAPSAWAGLAVLPLPPPGLEQPSPNLLRSVRYLSFICVFKRHLQCLPVAVFQSCRPQRSLGSSSHLPIPGTPQEAGRPKAPGYFLAADCPAEELRQEWGVAARPKLNPQIGSEARLFTTTPSPLLWQDKRKQN